MGLQPQVGSISAVEVLPDVLIARSHEVSRTVVVRGIAREL